MKLKDLIKNIDFKYHKIYEDVFIENISSDSRKIKKSGLFIAIKGEVYDGNNFILDAINNGAVVIVSEEKINIGNDVIFILVKSARKAFAQISKKFYGSYCDELKSIGITGTNGKTSTSHIIKHILDSNGEKTGLIGSITNKIGDHYLPSIRTTPEADQLHELFRRMKNTECNKVIIEVSSHALALKRVHAIKFDITIFTNLSKDHLDFHTSMEDYFKTKAELFYNIKNSKSIRIINIDNEWGRKLADLFSDQIITFGCSEYADVRIKGIKEYFNKTSFKIFAPWGSLSIKTPLIGMFNVYNTVAAIIASYCLKINLSSIKKSLKVMNPILGRMELVSDYQKKFIFVDYAHTEDALESALSFFKKISKNKIWIIFGCGGNRDNTKRVKMGEIASKYSDHIIITSDNPRSENPITICSEIKKGCKKNSDVMIIIDRKEAIEYAVNNIKSNDILLIAGKGHENYQEVNGHITNFNDHQVVKECINDK